MRSPLDKFVLMALLAAAAGSVAAQPYVIAAHGDITGTRCFSCADDVMVQSFTSRLGVAVTVTLLLHGPSRR